MGEYEKSLTVFYSKRTGEIKAMCQGIQDFSYFGEDAEDYSTIWNLIITENREVIFRNPKMFKVVENKLVFIGQDLFKV